MNWTLGVVVVAACSQQPSKLDDIAAPAAPAAPADLPSRIDALVTKALEDSKAPSASVAVVQHGTIIYTHAYGNARLDPPTPATPAMRYEIGSISKQFTAAAVMLLVEDGKLSLADPVEKYIPGLTSGDRITIRQLLNHTSGYRDYAPQDYDIPEWTQPTTPATVIDRWAKRPLDFEPGTKWQYSNTAYTIAGAIVEKVAGKPMLAFLKERVFDKLGMSSATDIDTGRLSPSDAAGYFCRAFGPAHATTPSSPGWFSAAGELAMTAEDLAKWDISFAHQTVLAKSSYDEIVKSTELANHYVVRYGLGVSVWLERNHRAFGHDGEMPGFTAVNIVLPDDDLAVAVLVNLDAGDVASTIGSGIINALIDDLSSSAALDARVTTMLSDLAHGQIDRAAITANASSYFTDEALGEYKAFLAGAGALQKLHLDGSGQRGGMTYYVYAATCANKSFTLVIYDTPDHKLEQFLIL
jgi:CubicO group peptidase (beta-lactamase class C family)